MPRYYGKIGYAVVEETVPGVYVETIVERTCRGDEVRAINRVTASENLNSDIQLNNALSIVADGFAYANFQSIRYVIWHGTKWRVTAVEVQRPRLILNFGEVYNGQ